MEVILAIIIFALIFCFYFLPAIISAKRNTKHCNAITLVNLLFGWTILGWIAALIWAVVEGEEGKG